MSYFLKINKKKDNKIKYLLTNKIVDIIETSCGLSADSNFEEIKTNDPNFVFEPDPNFSPVRLFDNDANTVIVNSWIECSHYVNGGWSINEPNLINTKPIFIGTILLLGFSFLIYKYLKFNKNKALFKSLSLHLQSERINHLKINKITTKILFPVFFVIQMLIVYPYIKVRSLNLTIFVDEYISLTSNVEFFKNLNYNAGTEWGGNYSIYLTSGPISAIGSAIGWNLTNNFTITRISNYYWILFLQLFFILLFYKVYKLDIKFLILGSSIFILLIPWWYGSLYSLGELASMFIFINSLFLYNKNNKLAMLLFGVSIFYGKILTLLPFFGFYILIFFKNRSLKKLINELSYFFVPLIIWLFLIYFKYENGNIIDYLIHQFKAITIHQSSGYKNLSASYFESIRSNINNSEFATWNYYDIFRLLFAPIIFSFLLLRNKKYIDEKFGEVSHLIICSLIFPYLWFWILSDTKWMRYSQHFTIIMLVTILLVVSSNNGMKKIDILSLLVLVIFFLDDQKNFILPFILFMLVASYFLDQSKYLVFSKYLLIFTVTTNFLIPILNQDINTREYFIIEECNVSLLSEECKNNYFKE